MNYQTYQFQIQNSRQTYQDKALLVFPLQINILAKIKITSLFYDEVKFKLFQGQQIKEWLKIIYALFAISYCIKFGLETRFEASSTSKAIILPSLS